MVSKTFKKVQLNPYPCSKFTYYCPYLFVISFLASYSKDFLRFHKNLSVLKGFPGQIKLGNIALSNSGYCTCRLFYFQHLSSLPTLGIDVFPTIPTAKSDYFPVHFCPVGLCNESSMCSLGGRNSVHKHHLD